MSDRLAEPLEALRDQIVGSLHPDYAEHGREALDALLARLAACEQERDDLMVYSSEETRVWRMRGKRAEARLAEAEQRGAMRTRLAKAEEALRQIGADLLSGDEAAEIARDALAGIAETRE